MSNLLALASSLVWGASDYVGGAVTKRAPARAVVLWSQGVGFFVALIGASVLGGRLDVSSAGWGAAAGVGGSVALVSFYQGLATGRMAVVAPIASLIGAGLPVAVGLGLGERPGLSALIGISIAIPAIYLVSGGDSGAAGSGVVHAIVAGLGFGMFFVFLAQTPDAAGLWPLVPARVASVATMAVAILISGTTARVESGTYAAIAVAGSGDMIANMLFLTAAQTGLLSVVSVLASLYPTVTVILARVFGEAVSAKQWLGVVLAVSAAMLIAA